MKKNKNVLAYAIAFVFFASGLAYLCIAGFSENSVYFLNVAEARTLEPAKLEHARLFGLVSRNELRRSPNSVAFNLADKDDAALTIPVVFNGIIPDAFRAGAEVIVEGGMDGQGRFAAKTLMTKCPSKYQKENHGRI